MIHPIEHPEDWYSCHISEYIDLLTGYIEDVEHHIDLSVNDFLNNKEVVVTNEIPELGLAHVFEFHRGMYGGIWDLHTIFTKQFPNLQRRSTLITLFGLFENELDELCRFIREKQNLTVELKDITDSGIERSTRFLSKVAGLKRVKETRYWSKIKDIQKIRNLVVHSDGRLTDANGNPKKTEESIIKTTDYLNGVHNVIIEKGFLKYVIQTFDSYFSHLDTQIKTTYNNH